MSECLRARDLLPQYVDGDLVREQLEWLDGHLKVCAECRDALAVFEDIDGQLTAWGDGLNRRSPATSGARERLAAGLDRRPAQPRAIRWIPAAAAAIAAAMALAVIAPPRDPAAGKLERSAFIEIPYVPPLDPHENATVVRMNIRVRTLIGAGYRVMADPDTIVPAEVLVGEDGRAHAVRVLSGIDWNGTGD
jgi:hypothetical protein